MYPGATAISVIDSAPSVVSVGTFTVVSIGPSQIERREHPVAVDVQFAPVSLGEGRECELPTGERGGPSLIRHAAASASSILTTWTFQSRFTSWTSQCCRRDPGTA